jgi:hypothetical protein
VTERWTVPTRTLRPGSVRHEHRSAPLGRLAVAGTVVAETAPVTVDVDLNAISGGVEVIGTVSAPFEAQCRRCTRPVHGSVEAEVRELYRPRAERGHDEEEDLRARCRPPRPRPAGARCHPPRPAARRDLPGGLRRAVLPLWRRPQHEHVHLRRGTGGRPLVGPRCAARPPAPLAQVLDSTGSCVGPTGATRRGSIEHGGRPEEEDLQSQEPLTPGERLEPVGARPQRVPAVPRGEAAPRGVPHLRLVQGPPGHRRHLTPAP